MMLDYSLGSTRGRISILTMFTENLRLSEMTRVVTQSLSVVST